MRKYTAVRHFIRRWRPALIALTSALALASCASGPSKVGAAAIVGDTRIPVDAVQADFRWLLNNIPEAQQLQEQKKLELLSQHALQGRIRHELIEVAARQEGLKADPRAVKALIDEAGGADKAPQQFRTTPALTQQFAKDIVLLRELGKNYVDRLSVKLVGAVIAQESAGATSRDKAEELAKQIAADPDRAKELAAQAGGQVIDDTLKLSEVMRSGEAALATSTPVFSVKPGTVVVTQPNPEQGSAWLVALVEERTVTVTADDSRPGSAEQDLAGVGYQLLRPIAQQQGVTVSPRFGVWDPLSMSVVDDAQQISGQLLTARASDQ